MFTAFVTTALVVIVAINIYIILRPVKYDGYIVINTEEGKKTFMLELDSDPDDLEAPKRVLFKVVDSQPQN